MKVGRPLRAVALLAGLGLAGYVAVTGFVLHDKTDSLRKFAPAESDYYVAVFTDPSVKQKLALNGLMQKFPDLSSTDKMQKQVDDSLDSALSSTGLSYRNDVKSWLGDEIAVCGEMTGSSPFAVMFSSTNDSAASSALTKVRQSKMSADYSWQQTSDNGVSVWVGKPKPVQNDFQNFDSSGMSSPPVTTTASANVVYAVNDHLVVVGNSESWVESILDTQHGKHSDITTQTSFTQSLASLPGDRLGYAYLNVRSVLKTLQTTLAKTSQLSGSRSGAPQITDQMINAYSGAATVVTATSDRIEMDYHVMVDTAALPPSDRPGSGDVTAVLADIPARAFVAVGMSGLKNAFDTLSQQLTSPSSLLSQMGAQYGLTDVSGLLSSLNGNVGFELDTAQSVGGALVFGVSDEAKAKSFLQAWFGKPFVSPADQIQSQFSNISNGLDASGSYYTPLPTPAPTAPPSQASTYRGIDVVTYPQGAVGLSIPIAYAVTKGGVILGTPAAVRNVIDTGLGGSNVTSSATFQAAVGSDQHNQFVAFVDINAAVGAIRDTMTGSARSDFDTQATKWLKPLRALVYTAASANVGSSGHFALLFN